MFSTKNHEQAIIEFSQGDYIAIMIESFMVDRSGSYLDTRSGFIKSTSGPSSTMT